MQIEVLDGAPCQCAAPVRRTRDDDAFLCRCVQCGRTWRIGLR